MENGDILISLLGEEYLVIHFDFDKYDLYLSRAGGGGVITYVEKFKVFIIGLYSDLQKVQNLDGVQQKQSLGMVIKAVDHARRYLSNFST